MTAFTGIVAFVLIWWTVLFAVLPLWTQPEPEGDVASGGWRGTPRRALILRKLLVTTAVSGVLWALFWLTVRNDWLSFRSGWLAMPAS